MTSKVNVNKADDEDLTKGNWPFWVGSRLHDSRLIKWKGLFITHPAIF